MSDATPAYRGYRRQTLYALSRILEPKPSESLVFQPEGVEDLSIEDTDGNLTEVIQVKDYSGRLTLGDFKPKGKSKESFFHRIEGYLRNYPEIELKLVSFGDIGKTFAEAVEADGMSREKQAEQLWG